MVKFGNFNFSSEIGCDYLGPVGLFECDILFDRFSFDTFDFRIFFKID